MEIEGGIDPDAPLDYVELQIFPCQNRYDAYVCSSNRAEKAASGALKQLLLHSPQVKDLTSKGSNMNFKVLPPNNVNDAEWFTTATLTRFLHILDWPDIVSIENEITQLEETKKFQLSLSLKAVVDITSSIDSKSELLRAVDLRLTALKDEVVTTFDQVTRARCSTKDISDLENFAHHIGAKDIRDLLQKFVEMNLFPTVEDTNKTTKKCVSPKVAQIKQHNSTENENSPLSSEEDQPSVDRYRAARRSTTPRRSASPMRRIQIGRSGSHRAPALTIKSLNHFPVREKLSFQKCPAGNSSDEDDNKTNVLRMSVQDKISLFESKQRDQKVQIPNTKKLLNITVGSNKAVLRRWSSGMSENVAPKPNPKPEPEPIPNVSTENIKPHSPEREESCEHPESIEWSQQNEAKLNELFMKMMEDKNKSVNNNISKQKRDEKLKLEASSKNTQKKLTPLLNSKREALNKPSVLKKPAAKPSSLPVTRKSWSSTPSPRTPTGPTFANKPVVSNTKTEKSRLKTLKSTPPDGNRHLKNINQNTQSTVTKSTKTAKTKVDQAPEAKVKPRFNKFTKKSSVVPLETKPFLRKGSGVGPGLVKSKVIDQPEETSRTLTHNENKEVIMAIDVSENEEKCKPQVVSLSPGPGPGLGMGPTKCEEPVMMSPTAWVEDESDNSNEEKCQPQVVSLSPGPGSCPSPCATKCEEPVMMSPTTWVEDESDNSNEEKCQPQVVSLSPGPGSCPSLCATKCEEPMMMSPTAWVEDESDNSNEEKCQPQVVSLSPVPSPGPGSCPSLCATKCEEPVMISPTAWVEEVEDESDNNEEKCKAQVVSLSPGLGPGPDHPSLGPGPAKCEEPVMISPTAWVEEVEYEQVNNNEEEMVIPCLLQSESPVKVMVPAGGSSSPRVRRSLSQMLLEESSEEAGVSEWGNAENPPSLVYQKESPKGFKRLLKFARKTKAESALLEADDDGAESKVTSQNHLMGPEDHVSASLNSKKGTRSFFSLSAFRASKTNESKLP